MTTLRALAADPDWTPYAINVLAPSLAEAQSSWRSASARYPRFPTSSPCRASFPTQQTEKLEAVADAAAVIEPAIEDVSVARAPSDEELQKRLADTEAALQCAAAKPERNRHRSRCVRLAEGTGSAEGGHAGSPRRGPGGGGGSASSHAGSDPHAAEGRAGNGQTLPPDLVADWTAKDGRVRLQVLPRAGQTDNEFLRQFAAAVQKVAPDATGSTDLHQRLGRHRCRSLPAGRRLFRRRHHRAAGRGAATRP